MTKTIIFAFGTRPEFIKMYPLILEAKKNSIFKVITCSTGQHREMLSHFYEYYGFRPDFDFNLMHPNQNLTDLHIEVMKSIKEVILSCQPHWIFVQGDTTTAHAVAMTAFYEKIKVAHVEAGLRTYDIHSPFPEELNRRAIALTADLHFCPTEDAANCIRNEKYSDNTKIFVTGNTGLDMLRLTSEKVKLNSDALDQFVKQHSNVRINNFILTTLHRRENFGPPIRSILKALVNVIQHNDVDILFPAHPNPNVQQAIREIIYSHNTIEDKGRLIITPPINYTSMVLALEKCRFVMTDSGGLQEEAPSFGKRIMVLREKTERTEAVAAGFATLIGADEDKIVQTCIEWLELSSDEIAIKNKSNPFGDGFASKKIIDALLSLEKT